MQWLRLAHPNGTGICVANLHASAHRPERAAGEVERAARAALEWSGARPLLLGGDFNVRPAEQEWLFAKLAAEGFSGPTGPRLIDHLLVRGGEPADAPRQLPAERREVRAGERARVRLSDHAVVVAAFDVE
jgi:endonuclease/exonuclease/phosphatase (EEP) superfamily protein YafD